MKIPNGYLVAIGGAEDKANKEAEEEKSNELPFSIGVLHDIADLTKGKDTTIAVLTTATSTPDESFKNYKKAFTRLGCTVHHLDISSREAAQDTKMLAHVERCQGLMITGGDQARLSSTLGGTPLLDVIKERYFTDHLVVAGTSAGAAAMSSTMMNGGDAERANMKGQINLSVGLGLISDVIIDTHFIERGRFSRLAQAIAHQPGILGIGLGEDTGVIIEKGMLLRAIGSGSVTIMDGSNIYYDNISDVKKGMPFSLAKLEVYLLSHSDRFDLHRREFTGIAFKPQQSNQGA